MSECSEGLMSRSSRRGEEVLSPSSSLLLLLLTNPSLHSLILPPSPLLNQREFSLLDRYKLQGVPAPDQLTIIKVIKEKKKVKNTLTGVALQGGGCAGTLCGQLLTEHWWTPGGISCPRPKTGIVQTHPPTGIDRHLNKLENLYNVGIRRAIHLIAIAHSTQ